MALGVMHGISVVFAPMMALLNVTTNGTLHLLGLKTRGRGGPPPARKISA